MAADIRSSDPITPVANLTVPADAGAESQLAAQVEAAADPRGILRGPLLPAIVRIAAPVLGLEAMHIAYHLVNLIWIGTLSAAASAALTTSLYATWVMTSLLDAIEIGIIAQVSRALGAGDRLRAGRAAAQGLLLALGLGLVFALGMRHLAAPLFRIIGVPAEVEPLAAAYLATIFAGAPVFFLMGGFEAIWRSTGDTMTPLKVVGVSMVINAVLDPLLIFGIGPLPALGIRGAALATILSWAVAFLIFAGLAARTRSQVPLERRALLQPDIRAIARTLRIGLPRFLIGSLFSSVYLAISSLVARFGTAALAMVGITNRLESMVYVSANALGAACGTMVGQNLGAKQPERARKVVNTAATVGVGLSIVPMLAMVFVPELCIRPFTQAPEVLALADPYLRIIGICQAFMVLELVYSAGFSGAGDTLPPMIIELPIAAARVPLSWFAAVNLGLGLDGIAWVLSLTCILRGMAIPLWFRTGRWQRRNL